MIDRKLCTPGFGYFLPWRCPACGQGTLECERDMLKLWSASGVAEAIAEGYMFPWDDYGVFSATLKCSARTCRQGVAVLGDYSSYELAEPQMAYAHRYSVRAFHPAIKIIDIQPGTPEPISDALVRSFGLFWSDHQACAGALRVAIEGIAEHLGEPRVVAGRFVPLGSRLRRLKTSHPDVVEAARAIKDVGNDGAHGDNVEQAKLLACYELLEIELRALFNTDAARRRSLINDIRK
jgi:Domain of unknown function (DUF4145)